MKEGRKEGRKEGTGVPSPAAAAAEEALFSIITKGRKEGSK
jgi:hypothetical protein